VSGDATLLAQGRFWRATVRKGGQAVVLALLRDVLPDHLQELRDLRIEVPLAKWNAVLKHVRSDRKLLGGVLLDFARNKDHLASAIAEDALYGEPRRVALDATAGLAEQGLVGVVPTASEG
jgi:hypothetical protein